MADPAQTTEQPLDAMVAAIAAKGDFPAAARVIQRLHEAVRRENCNALDVAQVILEDPGLSAKVLRIVNSSFYRPRGEPVSTITRAVFLLGFESIRDLATGLLLLDEIARAAGGHTVIRDVLRQCILCGSVARALSSTVGYPSPEEAYLLGLFANWGQLCLAAYFPEQYERAEKAAHTEGVSIERALGREFGIASTELSTAMLMRWNFPSSYSDYFTQSHATSGGLAGPRHKLFAIVDVANEYATLASDPDPAVRALADAKLRAAESVFGRRGEDLIAAALRGAEDAREHMPTLRLTTPHGAPAPAGRPAHDARVGAVPAAPAHAAPAAAIHPTPASAVDATQGSPVQAPSAASDGATGMTAAFAILGEITRSMLGHQNINDTLAMVLEGVARTGSFDAVFLALLNVRKDHLVGRLGCGAGVAEYLSGQQVPVEAGAGVLVEAILAREPMVVAEGTSAMLVAPGMPAPPIPAASFVVQPLIVRDKAVGVLVAARKAGAPRVAIGDLPLVQLFCNQAGLALDRTAG